MTEKDQQLVKNILTGETTIKIRDGDFSNPIAKTVYIIRHLEKIRWFERCVLKLEKLRKEVDDFIDENSSSIYRYDQKYFCIPVNEPDCLSKDDVDELIDKLILQITKHKEKNSQH